MVGVIFLLQIFALDSALSKLQGIFYYPQQKTLQIQGTCVVLLGITRKRANLFKKYSGQPANVGREPISVCSLGNAIYFTD